MKNWYKVTIRYNSINEKGKEQKVNEHFLIDGISFSDAENSVSIIIRKSIGDEFEVSSIQKKNFSEIIAANYSINLVDAEAKKILGTNMNQSSEADKWYECKVSFIGYDEQKKVEKKTIIEQAQPHVESIQKSFVKIKELTTERPDAGHGVEKATKTGVSWGLDMTYKKSFLNGKTHCLKFNIGGFSYAILNVNAKTFSAGGKVYSVSDFKEVE